MVNSLTRQPQRDLIRYRYIREVGTRKPIGCVAYALGIEGIQFGWSFCSPSDKWDTSKARMIARNRLSSDSFQELSYDTQQSPTRMLRDALQTIAEHFASHRERNMISIIHALSNDWDLNPDR